MTLDASPAWKGRWRPPPHLQRIIERDDDRLRSRHDLRADEDGSIDWCGREAWPPLPSDGDAEIVHRGEHRAGHGGLAERAGPASCACRRLPRCRSAPSGRLPPWHAPAAAAFFRRLEDEWTVPSKFFVSAR
jgi:hypothetical protein